MPTDDCAADDGRVARVGSPPGSPPGRSTASLRRTTTRTTASTDAPRAHDRVHRRNALPAAAPLKSTGAPPEPPSRAPSLGEHLGPSTRYAHGAPRTRKPLATLARPAPVLYRAAGTSAALVCDLRPPAAARKRRWTNASRSCCSQVYALVLRARVADSRVAAVCGLMHARRPWRLAAGRTLRAVVCGPPLRFSMRGRH